MIRELQTYGIEVDVHDPWVDPAEAQEEYGIELLASPVPGTYDAVIVTVGHDDFRRLGAEGLRAFCKPDGVLYDVKYTLPADNVDGRL